MLLAQRTAVVYGAGGSVGGAVARAFAREGATVFLAGRTADRLDRVVSEVANAGGTAQAAVLDVLDEAAVSAHADAVAHEAGGIDVAFNAVNDDGILAKPFVEMPFAEFAQPIEKVTRAHFLTTTAIAPHMIRQRRGVLLAISGSGPPVGRMGGCMVAWAALDALYGQLAAELGPDGIRVAWLNTIGLPESIQLDQLPPDTTAEDWCGGAEQTMLNRFATLDDVGNAAALLASDYANAMTATAANITCGAKA